MILLLRSREFLSSLLNNRQSLLRLSHEIRERCDGSKRTNRSLVNESDATSLSWQERQYDYAIAELNDAIKIQPPLRPSLEVEYQYNLAVIDNVIESSRDVARKNPKDLQAAQSMLAAYQSKVDLMNQVANAREPE
jgi:hypothetical protein